MRNSPARLTNDGDGSVVPRAALVITYPAHALASSIAAVAEGPYTDSVNQFPDNPCLYPWVHFETIHGDAGATPPTEASVCPRTEQGQVVGALVPIQPDHSPNFSYALPVTPDGHIALSCGAPVPALKKEDAIAALLAQKEPSGGATACVAYLTSIDPAWGETSCSSQ